MEKREVLNLSRQLVVFVVTIIYYLFFSPTLPSSPLHSFLNKWRKRDGKIPSDWLDIMWLTYSLQVLCLFNYVISFEIKHRGLSLKINICISSIPFEFIFVHGISVQFHDLHVDIHFSQHYILLFIPCWLYRHLYQRSVHFIWINFFSLYSASLSMCLFHTNTILVSLL